MENLAPALDAPVDYGVTAEVRAPQNLYALKDKDTFIVADEFGDIAGQGDGLFHNDTRILSFYRLSLGGRAPSLLSAAVGVLATAPLVARTLFPRMTARLRQALGKMVVSPPATRLQIEQHESPAARSNGHVGFTLTEMIGHSPDEADSLVLAVHAMLVGEYGWVAGAVP